jgi:RNA polymerase sigma-70 factor (ECF subfamily)
MDRQNVGAACPHWTTATTIDELRILDPSSAVSAKAIASAPTVIDREDLAAFRDGRRDVLARVYRAHVGDVVAVLRRGFAYTTNNRPARYPGVRDTFELESLVQEVFTRAFEPRARLAYDGVRAYPAFLAGIARNLVLDRLRKQARHGEVLAAPEVLDTTYAGESPTDRERSEDERRGRELVTTFLETACDERDRSLYGLRYERELSQVDAARTAGLTRIQVRRWETKFRARLLRYLKRADYMRERP